MNQQTVTDLIIQAAKDGDWGLAKRVVQEALRVIGSAPAEEPTGPVPPPATPFPTPTQNIRDALHHANQKHADYLRVDRIYASYDRAAYRRALHNLWNVISYYQQEGQ